MNKFKVGDLVEIINDSSYDYTKKGSIGVVEYVRDSYIHVKFKTIGKGKYKKSAVFGDDFDIYVKDLALITPLSQQELVINKIREMESRRKVTSTKVKLKKHEYAPSLDVPF